jgi:hypothetical protein
MMGNFLLGFVVIFGKIGYDGQFFMSNFQHAFCGIWENGYDRTFLSALCCSWENGYY